MVTHRLEDYSNISCYEPGCGNGGAPGIRIIPGPASVPDWLCTKHFVQHVNDGSLALTSGQPESIPEPDPPAARDDSIEVAW